MTVILIFCSQLHLKVQQPRETDGWGGGLLLHQSGALCMGPHGVADEKHHEYITVVCPVQCGAVHFIENVSAENLQVDEEEFNTYDGRSGLSSLRTTPFVSFL